MHDDDDKIGLKVAVTDQMGFVDSGRLPGIPSYDPVKREHYWTVVVAYHVDPQPGVPGMLDERNLREIGGPACFYCEEDFHPSLANSACPGESVRSTLRDVLNL